MLSRSVQAFFSLLYFMIVKSLTAIFHTHILSLLYIFPFQVAFTVNKVGLTWVSIYHIIFL